VPFIRQPAQLQHHLPAVGEAAEPIQRTLFLYHLYGHIDGFRYATPVLTGRKPVLLEPMPRYAFAHLRREVNVLKRALIHWGLERAIDADELAILFEILALASEQGVELQLHDPGVHV